MEKLQEKEEEKATKQSPSMIILIQQLGNPLPSEAIQRTRAVQTKKGYDTDGYKYQFCINRFNEILGDRWGFSWKILNEKNGTAKSGNDLWELTVQVDIWLETPDHLHPRSCVGSHTSRTYGDALKGAIINGFKKTAAFWGVGRQAYEGALDDDADPWLEWTAQNNEESPATPPPATPPPAILPPATLPPAQSTPPPIATSPSQSPPLPLPPSPSTPSPANMPPIPETGRESGLRRRISAKLDTIFARSANGIAQFLQPFGGNLTDMNVEQLEKILATTESKFEEWKTGK